MDLLDTRRPRALLAAFCLLLWLPGFFSLPTTDRDESRFALASRQMIETGDYVRIMNGAEARNRKPIGIYWLQVPFAAAARALHVATVNPIWPYRIPSLLGGFTAVFAVLHFGELVVGRRVALLGAGMLAGSVLLVVEVHLAKTDAALLGATVLCMGVLSRAYLRPAGVTAWNAGLFWLAMGAGVLLKGPITPVVALLTAGTLIIADRRAGWLRVLRPQWGIPLLILVVLPWFAAIGVATHGAFFRDAIGGDLAGKLAGGDDAHGAPPGMHFLLMPLLAFPSSFVILAALPGSWRARREPAIRFLLAWLIPCWLMFEAVPTKLPHYTLPLYPALCLLGAWFCLGATGAVYRRWSQVAVFAPMAAGFILACAAAAAAWVAGSPGWIAVPAALAAALIGWLGADRRGPVAALAAMPLLTLALLAWELPHADGLWLARGVRRVVSVSDAGATKFAAVTFHEPSLVFALGTATDLLPDGAAGADWLTSGQGDAVVVGDRDEAGWQAAAKRLGLVYERIGVVTGFNYSRGRKMTLAIYRRAS